MCAQCHAATHTAIVTECGTVFTCGSNEQLQLGHSTDLKEVPHPVEVDIPEKVVAISAGGAFTVATTDGGALYGVRTPYLCNMILRSEFSC